MPTTKNSIPDPKDEPEKDDLATDEEGLTAPTSNDVGEQTKTSADTDEDSDEDTTDGI